MATKKQNIDAFKDRWTSPFVSNLKLPKEGKKKTVKKSTKRTK